MGRNRFLRVVGDVRSHRPVVTIGTYFGVDEESIEQPESLRQRMMIGRNAARKEDERGISITLRQVTEDLIVGTVLLDDVDDVLERWVFLLRMHSVPAIRRGYARGESIQLRSDDSRRGNDIPRTIDLTERVVGSVRRHPLTGLPVARIGSGTTPFGVYHQQIVSLGQNRRRVPPYRNSSCQLVITACSGNSRALCGELENANGIVVGFGNEQPLPV